MFSIHPAKYFFLFLAFACMVSMEAFPASPTQPITEQGKTDYLYTLLKNKGFSPVKQALVPLEDHCFPDNIIITISSGGANKVTDETETHRNKCVFAFTQQFAFENIDNLYTFIEYLQDKAFPYTPIILLSANDKTILPETIPIYHEGGTSVFTASLDDADAYCAIVVEQSKNGIHEIIPGGSGDTSPSWLVQTLRHACALCRTNSEVSSSFISFYRNGILKENNRVSSFLSMSIPAASISIDGSQKDFAVLTATADTLVKSRTDRWDRHYSYLPAGSEGILLGESFYALSYFLFAIISLFILCFFSFTQSSHMKVRTKDVLSIWYVIPVTVLLTGITLFATQSLFPNAPMVKKAVSPVLLFGVKIFIVLSFTVIAFIVHLKVSSRISFSSYGFFMVTIAVANIFIFSTVDISLVFLFFFEYLFVLLANKAKSITVLICTFFLMLLPFIPYLIDLLKFATIDGMFHLVRTDFSANILLAFILFPFQMQFFRILISLDLFSKERREPMKAVLLRSALTTLVTVGSFSALYFIFSSIILRNNSFSSDNDFVVVDGKNSNDITASFEKKSFMELTTCHLNISSNKQIIRYIVSVSSSDTVPLYDCNYDYTLEGEHTAFFNLPDYPSNDVEILYSSDPKAAGTVRIDAYFAGKGNTILLESKQLELKSVEE